MPHAKLRSALTLAALVAGCDGSDELLIDNDEAVLETQVERTLETVQMELSKKDEETTAGSSSGSGSGTSGLQTCKSSKMTLTANIASPLYADQAIQANSITVTGSVGIVGFNTAGEAFQGGLQLIDLSNASSPKLLSQAFYPGQDINSVLVGGSSLYVGLSELTANGAPPAVVERLELNNKKQIVRRLARMPLSSYAVTGMVYSSSGKGGTLYVAVGAAGGGLYKLNAETLEVQSFVALDDARGVAFGLGNTVVVLKGTPATLVVYDSQTLKETKRYALSGLSAPFAKATLQIRGSHAFVALGDGGFQVVSLTDGSVRTRIDNPILPDMDPSWVVTNGASADGNRVFIATGGAGLRYACLNQSTSELSGGSSTAVTSSLVGTLRLGQLESFNDVAFEGKSLIAPSGKGGVRIVTVE